MSDGANQSPTVLMSESTAKSLDPSEAQPFFEEPSRGVAPLGQRPGGKIVHDARGTAIWDYTDTVPGVSTSTGVLRLLEAPALEIAGEPAHAGEWAGDPYNRSRGSR